MRFLRTNTAARITVGPFYDSTDGVTPETAITVTSEKLTLMVDTGNVPTLVLDTAPTASGGSNDMVHVTGDDAGFYDLELAAADVNYLGRALLALTNAGVHCPVWHEFTILPAVVYDAMVLGTDNLDVSAVQFAGQTITAAAGVTLPTSVASPTNITSATGVALTSAYDPAKTAAQAGDAMALTSGERTTLAAAIWNALTSGLATASSIGKLLVDNINATISSRLPTSSYTAPLDAAGTRTALGLASADLDTQLDALPTAAENADALLARNAAGGANSAPTVGTLLLTNDLKFSISGGVLTVYAHDGTTPLFTRTLSRSALDAITDSV